MRAVSWWTPHPFSDDFRQTKVHMVHELELDYPHDNDGVIDEGGEVLAHGVTQCGLRLSGYVVASLDEPITCGRCRP